MDKLREVFNDIFFEDKLTKMVFSSKRQKSLPYSKVTIRPVSVKAGVAYQAEYTYPSKATHRNLLPHQTVDFCLDLLAKDFKQVNAFTVTKETQILASKVGSPHISTHVASLAPASLPLGSGATIDDMACALPAHNRTKNYIIPDGEPCDFLIRLGVMDQTGKVYPKHYSKFRQINRYLEIVNDVFDSLPKPSERPLRIIDFGCGKAYLTFAIYHYLKLIKKLDVEIIGLDLKEEVIQFCSEIAEDLNYQGLRFLHGDIADFQSDYADMVVTLHACDTATDFALINAVKWGSKVILSVPCCQHQLFKQIKNPIHQPMLKHGILKDRLTEYLTDGLRGLKLESAGYQVSMIEFTSLEHTARNIMIKAVLAQPKNIAKMKKAQVQYEALRDFYEVNPTIDGL